MTDGANQPEPQPSDAPQPAAVTEPAASAGPLGSGPSASADAAPESQPAAFVTETIIKPREDRLTGL